MSKSNWALPGILVSVLLFCNVSFARYVEADPIGQGGGINPYEYAAQNPLTFFDPNGLKVTCYFNQYSGSFFCQDTETGNPLFNVFTYSGAGCSKNNPCDEGKKDWGPIPKGNWKIDLAIDVPGLGSPVFPLSEIPPFNTNLKYRRSGFLIHGPNPLRLGDSSTGCIILDKRSRDIILQHGGGQLYVIDMH